MKVYERIAQAFKGEGITHIFGMMGDGNMYWLDALDKTAASNASKCATKASASAWPTAGRATRTRPGVHRDLRPGRDAARDRLRHRRARRIADRRVRRRISPADQDYVQRYDQAPFAAACEAGFVRIETPEYTDEAIRKAFYLAKLESRPIMLSCPMDVQQAKFEDDDPYVPSSTLFPAGGGRDRRGGARRSRRGHREERRSR